MNCKMKNIYSKNKHCKCGKLISNNAKQCNSCASKKRQKENPSRYIDGRTNKKYYCIDCGIKISFQSAIYGTFRCRICSAKARIKSKHYCSCGQQINYRSKRCNKCENKRKYLLGIINNKGNRNGRWNGGTSFEPYSIQFTYQLKESIRARDKYTCQKCGKKQKNYRRALDVHHIDYNKKNCKKNNLVALCSQCNTMVNSNRDYWFAYFTYIMEN